MLQLQEVVVVEQSACKVQTSPMLINLTIDAVSA